MCCGAIEGASRTPAGNIAPDAARRRSRPAACARGQASRILFGRFPPRCAAARSLDLTKANMSPDFIYTMKDLRKVVPPKREILKGIWLSFYYGAKIGVLGANGAGKSSLLRIMSGADPDFIGEAFLGKGFTVGFLEQEPKLDPKKTVLGNVQDGVGDKMKVVNRWNEISAKFAEPMEDDAMAKLIEEQGKVQDQMDSMSLWDLDRQLEIA